MSSEQSASEANTLRMPGFSRAQFILEYTRAMDEGRAALFLGAGASIPAGFVSWTDLMRDIAAELDLDVDRSDLLTLAQYHVNHRGGRHAINELIVEEFDRRAEHTPLHDHMVRLPIDELWTTNYDRIIEDAYEAVGRRPDVKTTVATLASHKRQRDVTVYKMHGDARAPDEAVLTRDDYERYHVEPRGQAFMTALQASLLNRTFLFIGFSFSDPNIGHVLARMRLLIGQHQGEHFAIFRRPVGHEGIDDPVRAADAKFAWRSTQLQIDDLKRFGIHVVLVDEYADIAPLVSSLVKSSGRNYVFVSGAAHDFAPFGEERLAMFSQALGAKLAETNKCLISGLGLGIGQDVVQGFFQAGFDGRARDVGDRAILRPFPQRPPGGGVGLREFWTAYRTDMLQRAGFVIYVAGNKRDRATGETVPSNGMFEEFDLAHEVGAVPIPVGATGHVAAELWRRVTENAREFYPEPERITAELTALNAPETSDTGHLDAILRIMTVVSRSYNM